MRPDPFVRGRGPSCSSLYESGKGYSYKILALPKHSNRTSPERNMSIGDAFKKLKKPEFVNNQMLRTPAQSG